MSLYLLKKIRLDYDYSMGSHSYPGGQFIADSSWIGRGYDFEAHSVGVYFRLKDNIGIGVRATRWIRDSTLDWWDTERDFIGLNLTYDF